MTLMPLTTYLLTSKNSNLHHIFVPLAVVLDDSQVHQISPEIPFRLSVSHFFRQPTRNFIVRGGWIFFSEISVFRD